MFADAIFLGGGPEEGRTERGGKKFMVERARVQDANERRGKEINWERNSQVRMKERRVPCFDFLSECRCPRAGKNTLNKRKDGLRLIRKLGGKRWTKPNREGEGKKSLVNIPREEGNTRAEAESSNIRGGWSGREILQI